jgi:hypothetical protein
MEHNEAFDPETVKLLTDALDEAWNRVQGGDARFNGQEEEARAALAKHIFDMAKQGERDRQGLVDAALLRFKL